MFFERKPHFLFLQSAGSKEQLKVLKAAEMGGCTNLGPNPHEFHRHYSITIGFFGGLTYYRNSWCFAVVIRDGHTIIPL